MKPKLAPCLVALSVLWSLGCAAEKSRPPPCTDIACYATEGPTLDIASGGTDGSDDTPNVAGAGTAVSIRGQIIEVADSTYAVSNGNPLTGNFVVEAPAAGTGILAATVSSTFSLDGIGRQRAAWLVAKPSANSLIMPGVVGFDATLVSDVIIPVVRRSSLELVAGSLSSMTTLDNTMAQVVLRFVNSRGQGVTGIQVGIPGAAAVAYDFLGGYSSDAAGTGPKGLAFLFNIPASSIPLGATLTFGGVVTGQYSLWVEAGAATIVEVLVSA